MFVFYIIILFLFSLLQPADSKFLQMSLVDSTGTEGSSGGTLPPLSPVVHVKTVDSTGVQTTELPQSMCNTPVSDRHIYDELDSPTSYLDGIVCGLGEVASSDSIFDLPYEEPVEARTGVNRLQEVKEKKKKRKRRGPAKVLLRVPIKIMKKVRKVVKKKFH